MPRFERFEEIEAWQKARQLAQAVYDACSDARFARDFPLGDQIRRGAISVMANISEGFGRSWDREFLHFLAVAEGSVHEAGSHLYVALDHGYVTPEPFAELQARAAEVGRMIGGLMEYLRRSGMKGGRLRPVQPPDA
jgi:four helix bundle protein